MARRREEPNEEHDGGFGTDGHSHWIGQSPRLASARGRPNDRARREGSARGASELAADHQHRRPTRRGNVRGDVPRPPAHRIPSVDDAVLHSHRHTALPAHHEGHDALVPGVVVRAARTDRCRHGILGHCRGGPRTSCDGAGPRRHHFSGRHSGTGRTRRPLRRCPLDRGDDAARGHRCDRRTHRPQPGPGRMGLGQGRSPDSRHHDRRHPADHSALPRNARSPVDPHRRPHRLWGSLAAGRTRLLHRHRSQLGGAARVPCAGLRPRLPRAVPARRPRPHRRKHRPCEVGCRNDRTRPRPPHRAYALRRRILHHPRRIRRRLGNDDLCREHRRHGSDTHLLHRRLHVRGSHRPHPQHAAEVR